MIVRKLRLENGWSQKQLAEIADLSVRTVQRVEQGDKPGLESMKSLASVFKVDVSVILSEQEEAGNTDSEDKRLEAIGYIQGIKEFYVHASIYAVLTFAALIQWGLSVSLIVWLFFCWGVLLLLHGLVNFDKATFIGPRWEKRILEKRMGKKL
ncbi:MAG: transcriptional regulator with XRE-family HTH domain [Pseudohongiellaceae bacterium]|jgi:transcriptional regulator with XRE-family HTH domain